MKKLITVDFETFYSKDFSLSKMTTEAYVRSPEFEVIGVGVKVEDGPEQWFSGTMEETKAFLDQFDWANSHAIAHNMAFDGAILSWHFGIVPYRYIDTLSMARPVTQATVGGSLAKLAKKFCLGEKGTEVINALGKRLADFTPQDLAQYGEYCKNDVQLTYNLYHVLEQFSTPQEMFIIDLMIRMYTDPVLELDKELLTEHLEAVQAKKNKLLAKVEQIAGGPELMSNQQFAEVLKKLGVEPPTKISARTNKETYAFGKNDLAFKALLEHPDERVQAVVAARFGVKSTLEETRTASFIGISERGALPIMLNYYGAHTGRASGGDKINLQNLPRGGALRAAIRAPEGHALVASDSSQIEARVVAWLAGEDNLVAAFAEGRDIYSEFATSVYGKTVTKADKVERFVGKTCVSEGTLVLSDSGWKPIELVTTADLLWDGEEWVCHHGLVNNGIKPTLSLCGAWLTPDHQVLSGTQWLEAQSAVQDESTLCRVLERAVENLPSQAMWLDNATESKLLSSGANAPSLSIPLTATTLRTSKVRVALSVLRKRLVISGIGRTPKQCRMMHTVQGYSTGSQQQSPDVIAQAQGSTRTTVAEVYKYVKRGVATALHFLSMFKPFQGGTTQRLRWTGSTLMAGMNPETLGSYQEVITCVTSEKSQTLKTVYDILNCGSRNRFTILTDAGPAIVHNCILGLGYGMGKDKFQTTLKVGQGGIAVDIDIEEAERIVTLYRTKYANIVKLWAEAQKALKAMVAGYEYTLGVGIKLRCTPEGIELPNGMWVRYANLRMQDGQVTYDNRFGPTKIYGGKMVENIVQALARIVVFDQMAAIDHTFRKYDAPDQGVRMRTALTVHDEVVAVVPEKRKDQAKEFMMKVMKMAPDWASGLPVACEADAGANYGECK